jgi:uncharacterized membrane protein YbaN (DUF454 family)
MAITSTHSHDEASEAPPRGVAARLWRLLGWTSVGLGLVGVAAPLLPTTPFLLLAAAAFGRGDPRLRAWLLAHPRFGATLGAWERHRAIPRRAKRLAFATMAGFLAVSATLSAPGWVLAIQAVCLGLAATFIATRPDAPPAEAG